MRGGKIGLSLYMVVLLFFFTLILSIQDVTANIIINEIMADPVADETLNEWIEIYNNRSSEFDIQGYSIGDDEDIDELEGGLFDKKGTILPAFGYGIITDEATRVYNNYNVSGNAVRLYIEDSSIGKSGLSNDGKTLFLYGSDNNLVDRVIYNKTKESKSWSLFNEEWITAEPTPGYSNNGSFEAISQDRCDYKIEIILEKMIFSSQDDFNFNIKITNLMGEKTNITVRASISDLFETLIKEYKPFTNSEITRQKTSSKYTPNLKEGKSYIISANLSTTCNESNLDNNLISEMVTILGKPKPTESKIEIGNIYDLGSDDEAKFGQIIRFRLEVYKGDSTKNSIAAWIEDKKENRISKQTKTNVYEEFTSNSLTLPIQINPNCNHKFNDGYYYIVVEGLDTQDSKRIRVKDITNALCPETCISEKKTIKSSKFEYELIELEQDENDMLSKLRLSNSNDEDIDLKVWSYVYRGNKCYSGEREDNLREFVLPKRTTQTIKLKNTIKEADPGDYKYKILINKDNQKTDKEIVQDITVEESQKKSEEINTQIGIEDNIKEQRPFKFRLPPITVYESVDEKIKKLTFIFLISLSIILNIVLIWKR